MHQHASKHANRQMSVPQLLENMRESSEEEQASTVALHILGQMSGETGFQEKMVQVVNQLFSKPFSTKAEELATRAKFVDKHLQPYVLELMRNADMTGLTEYQMVIVNNTIREELMSCRMTSEDRM